MRPARGEVRLIGGRWRGRRLAIADAPGLRPTSDRIRETLFNWVAPWIEGARCLDAFAGSGALGFEALSRGAREAILLERDRGVARLLEANAEKLGAERARILRADTLDWLAGPGSPFDLVFLDPPFASDLMAPALERLAAGGWVGVGTHLYVEATARQGLPALPGHWDWLRERRAGQVCFGLALVRGAVAVENTGPAD